MSDWQTIVLGESKLVMHMGASPAKWDDVVAVPTPEPTKSWQPVAHARVVEEVIETLGRTGLAVRESAFGLYSKGQRFFGLLGLDVRGGDGEYQVVVGVRNSHDMSFPVGMVVGSRVFVCDNLAFTSEIQVTRRHTTHILDDLPRLIATAVGKIGETTATQERRFAHYREFDLTDAQAHDLIIQAVDTRAIGPAGILPVLNEWRKPTHAEFAVRANAWRLFNGFTETFKRVQARRVPRRSIPLQGLFDAYTRFVPVAAPVGDVPVIAG